MSEAASPDPWWGKMKLNCSSLIINMRAYKQVERTKISHISFSQIIDGCTMKDNSFFLPR